MKQFESSHITATVTHLLRAAVLLGIAVLSGCGRFDGRRATAAEIFSDKRVRALAEAAGNGDGATIDLYVKEGVDVNAKGRGNVTPLLYCLWRQNKPGYEALLRHKADPNVPDSFGNAVVHAAAGQADPFWLRLAIEYGAKPNLINTGSPHFPNQTPIYRAIQPGGPDSTGRPESVKLLIAAKADLNHQDASGWNPPLKAADAGNYEIVLLLLEAGADFRQTTRGGHTLVDWVRHRQVLKKEVFESVVDEDQRLWFHKVVAFLEANGVDMTANSQQ